ncbi:signal peptidase I [Candidatus Woesearchaeota archaeon]|nr:signal peptidase I [Candidatus Woesearchaeota archaeon]
MSFKRIISKIWDFLWREDSLASWLVNLVLAFVIVKFVIYPLLGFFLATSHPIVAVVSSSMEHQTNFDEWWRSQSDWYENYGFSKTEAKKWPFKNGFNKGDIMILRGKKPKNIMLGDVIVFRGNSNDPIIHRMIKKDINEGRYFFQTKGDNPLTNPDSFEALGEVDIPQENVIGTAVFRIPYLGWVKIFFVDILSKIGVKGLK